MEPVMELRTLRYFVTVAEERHFGRAAARLHMTQPPLSRAIKLLETGLGTALLHRSPSGVSLTAAGTVLYDEARDLLERAEAVRRRVTSATGPRTLRLGVLGDSATQTGGRLAAAYRRRHPEVRVQIRESDFTDPTAGLRADRVDIALTRAPFDTTGLTTHILRTDPVGAILRADDPLAGRTALHLRDLADRRWVRLPADVDPQWSAYWGPSPASPRADHPVIRTTHECVQAVLWDSAVGLAPMTHALPEGLIAIPLTDKPPSPLLLIHPTNPTPALKPLINTLTGLARSLHRA